MSNDSGGLKKSRLQKLNKKPGLQQDARCEIRAESYKFMIMPNAKKVILVVSITVLIWVWADLAQDDELTNVPARIYVDEAANPGLWVSLDKEPLVPIKITLCLFCGMP